MDIKVITLPIVWIGQNAEFDEANKRFNHLLSNGYRPIATSTFSREDVTYVYHILEKKKE